MATLSIQLENHEWIKFITYKIHFSLSNENVIEYFSSIACNSIIASNQQRQEHNTLTLTHRAILKGPHKCFKSLVGKTPKTQMTNIPKIDEELNKKQEMRSKQWD